VKGVDRSNYIITTLQTIPKLVTLINASDYRANGRTD